MSVELDVVGVVIKLRHPTDCDACGLPLAIGDVAHLFVSVGLPNRVTHPGSCPPAPEVPEAASAPMGTCVVCRGVAFGRCARCNARGRMTYVCDTLCSTLHEGVAHPRPTRRVVRSA